VAVLGVAGSPEQLDVLAAELLDQVRTTGCSAPSTPTRDWPNAWRSRPTWISGVAAETRREIDQALARIGRAAPMVIGEFRIVPLSD
jgi:hypothetical protein